jgi:starch phosphorylase
MEEKRGLVSYVNDVHHAGFDERIFTIGFARRATEYKRGNMLFGDISRLNAIAEKFGGLQIVYAGKAHPRDENGKHLIQGIVHGPPSSTQHTSSCPR